MRIVHLIIVIEPDVWPQPLFSAKAWNNGTRRMFYVILLACGHKLNEV